MIHELRTIVSNDKIDEVLNYFNNNSSKKEEENQVIYNYHTEGDLRLIRTSEYLKLNLRKNNNENTVYVSSKYDNDLIDMFREIGIAVDFKRYRTRYKYIYESFYITIDKTLKVGNILRVKINYLNESDLKSKLEIINNLFMKLGIEHTDFEKFQEIYGKYRTSWNDLVGNINDDDYLK